MPTNLLHVSPGTFQEELNGMVSIKRGCVIWT